MADRPLTLGRLGAVVGGLALAALLGVQFVALARPPPGAVPPGRIGPRGWQRPGGP